MAKNNLTEFGRLDLRMVKALQAGKGVRLSWEELKLLLTADEAVMLRVTRSHADSIGLDQELVDNANHDLFKTKLT